MTKGTPWILRLRAIAWALNLTRVNLILLLLTTVLLSVPQGQDLLRGMAEDGGLMFVSLYGSSLLWATSIWLWARVLLDIDFPYAPVPWELMAGSRKLLPRLLGVLAFLALTLNLAVVDHWGFASFVMALEGLLFFLAVTYRRNLGRWIARRLRPAAPETHWAWADRIGTTQEAAPQTHLYQALHRVRGWIAAGTFLLGIPLFIWGMSAPLSMGQQLDTLLLLMLWGATLLPLASVLTYHASRKGIPIVLISLILLLGFSFWNDNHAIRIFASGHSASQRPGLEEALTAWHAKHCNGDQCSPFLLVATAGGGIRAAYWTGTLLGTLHDRSDGRLADQLFAISGVSGGSVGATVYRAVVANQPGESLKPIQQILGQDYLGPVSAGLLYKDLMQRFLPLPWLEDRATVFEKGLEAGFAQALPNARHSLTSSLIESASLDNQPWPALFLNATWSDNGRRIVAASLRTEAFSPPRDNRILYQDLLTTLGGDLRLSTAAHNSARFPLVSPPGGWRPADGNPQAWQRLQDGGLFENYGAETALELLAIAESLWRDRWGFELRPYVVLISSDPTLPDALAGFQENPPLSFGYELLSTLRTYASTRGGRGVEAASRLQQWVAARDAGHGENRFFHLRMCPPGPDKQQDPPLGWFLSTSAQATINGYLGATSADGPKKLTQCVERNKHQLDRLVQIMRQGQG